MVSESRQAKYLLEHPYWNGTEEALAAKLGLSSPVRSPLAIEAPLFFARAAVQASTFTIHPYPDGGTTIEECLPEPTHLVRYIVPASAKDELMRQLRVVGFSERHLFPDLEGLSRMIVFDNRTIAYGPPSPPECSGEVT